MQRDIDERLTALVAGSPGLGDFSKSLRKAISKFFDSGALKPLKQNVLSGFWLEHPLHPVLTDIPIGGWTVALALDLFGMMFQDRRLGKASGIAIGVGVLGAAGAIATGLPDYADMDPPEDRLALLHGVTNLTATALFAASFLLRRRNGWRTEPSHVALAGLGYLAVTAGGFLGGSMVFRSGVMINRNAYRQEPKEFTRAIAVIDLPKDKPTRVMVKGQPILLLKRGGQVFAVGAVCSHYGAPLEEGTLEGDTIVCPWHGSIYSLKDGSYVCGPTTAPVPAYDVRLEGGYVEVKLREE